ncbi:hypothetical protein PABG_01053 [Paracoccidioides brasiliensis Pb03]|uniref:Uncharacterized protein n=1 Tax=Paracoccidioides brasiliensis (strain Pb18) TaxID=502780 RepID=C1GAZ8_PARBD|nr:uncharacterized protein PADG_04434 [Paracoccidioides brasiliensis Pb18]EEH18734.2 hypothetical protein PABG_01053 [Paracoccidioides brasiliensis Pb03]EEH48350.2 hypothetical protein PADG_04434 [Paracoccidioides brasiliensis Pb18]
MSAFGHRKIIWKIPRLTVILHLNHHLCKLDKLEELADTSLILSPHITDAQQLSPEIHQFGFANGRLKITVLANFGAISPMEWRAMSLIEQRKKECRDRLVENDRLVPQGRTVEMLVQRELEVASSLEKGDVEDREY